MKPDSEEVIEAIEHCLERLFGHLPNDRFRARLRDPGESFCVQIAAEVSKEVGRLPTQPEWTEAGLLKVPALAVLQES